jgi:hypothetical protein
MTCPPLFRSVYPCPFGELLGTGYFRFETLIGIAGLAKWSATRLDLLAVSARATGQGQFREFIRQAKTHYRAIYVWEDWNPIVGPALARYGFIQVIETGPDGEILHGWLWRESAANLKLKT